MRRLTACVLMMTLLLCSCKAAGGETPEEAALAVRDAYLDGAGWNADADITASVGDKVFDFTLAVQWRREGETVLEYDGAGLSLGLLDGQGLTAVSAVPWLMEQIDKGYMAKCVWAGEGDGQLAVTFRDPEGKPGTGTEYLLVFDRESRALLSAEVSVDGTGVLTAAFRNFTMEMKQDDTGDGEDLG